MTATTLSPSTVIAVAEPVFANAERLALAGFLAGYTGLTREAYALDLRQYASWCQQHPLRLFQARRADIECFARDLEANGRARATVTRRLCTIAGFYQYAVEEELLDHSPAAHVRRPWLDYDSHAIGLDRNELGSLLVAAGLGPPAEHALISLLALNGLRVSEATGADVEAMGVERGHRTLVITRKGGKIVAIPLAPRTARAIDLAIGERCDGPIFLAADGRRLDRHGAARIVRRVARRAGITKTIGPHTLRHAFTPRRWMPESRCEMCRRLHLTPIRGQLCVMTGPGPRWTGTRPTLWPPTSLEPPGKTLPGWYASAWPSAARRMIHIAIDVTDRDGIKSTRICAATWIARMLVVTAPERLFGSRPGGNKPWLV
jgi:site-specific recombinase XerD